MDFWSDLSKTIYNAADYTVKGTEKLTGIAKITYKINSLKSKLDSYYKNAGELKYSEHLGVLVSEKEYEAVFSEIDNLKDTISELENKLAELKDYIACPECQFRVKRNLHYCPKCGAKLNENK